jgi:hypothetical protein
MLPRILLLLLGLSFASACSEDTQALNGKCTKGSECPAGFTCRKGACVCENDEACAEGEICNTQGICQKRTACRSNEDCTDPNRFCDIGSGNCIERVRSDGAGACGAVTHCLPGSVCDIAAGKCVDGCYDHGDCPLGQSCNRTGLTAPRDLGACSTMCGDKTFCPYGYKCGAGMCIKDPDPNHCKTNCDQTGCGNDRNYCLVNSSYDPRDPRASYETFCGVECTVDSEGNDNCPAGYNCGGVVLLTQDQCTNNNECGGGGRVCAIGEGDTRGFCTCVADADCTVDRIPPICQKSCSGLGVQACQLPSDCFSNQCVPTSCLYPAGQPCTADAQCQESNLCDEFFGPGGGRICATNGSPCTSSNDCLCWDNQCFGTGRPCTTASDCLLTCQGGGCLLGAACAPLQGLLCPDVQAR